MFFKAKLLFLSERNGQTCTFSACLHGKQWKSSPMGCKNAFGVNSPYVIRKVCTCEAECARMWVNNRI